MSTVSWIYLILICAALISVGMYLFKRVVLFSFSFRKEGLLSGDYIHDLLGLLSDLR